MKKIVFVFVFVFCILKSICICIQILSNVFDPKSDMYVFSLYHKFTTFYNAFNFLCREPTSR